MKILVIGGMHGNEPLGPAAVKLFQANPINQVDAILGNEQAIAAQSRYVKADLNRSFPGRAAAKDYETRRAAELLALTKGYDLVLDFHNTHCPNNDCGFVGNTAPPQLYNVAAWLGLRRIIVADYECINKYAPNCISVEISLGSIRMDPQYWYKQISRLAQLETVPAADDVETFRFVYRMTLEDKERLNLPAQNLRAFEAIDSELAAAMGVAGNVYPIFVNDAYTPYNYGGLIRKHN